MQGDTYAFIVRIWHESEDRDGKLTAWRGSIEHVGSGTRLYFRDLDTVVRFIGEQVGLNTKPDSKWRALLARIRHETT